MSFVFGESLKGFRQRAGVTQEELGDAIGRIRNTVQAWESSRYKPDSRELVLRISEFLYLSPEETDSLLLQADFPLEYGTTGQGKGNGPQAYGFLKITTNLDYGRIYVLHKARYVIGRHLQNSDLFLHDNYRSVSRVHAAIERRGDEVYIEDLQSTHGTFVNERRVLMPRALQPGQHILLGGEHVTETVCVLEFALDAHSTAR